MLASQRNLQAAIDSGIVPRDITNILLLYKQVDGGEIVPDILGDDLRLNLVDPAVNIITALFIQDVPVRVKQFLAFLCCYVLQFLPLVL